ncbi:MAG TPA: alpha amylase C-terminal domain-containing protein, partial [Planctomycetia bacterium]|nr:alpha amylase C-terminal domain-containing protein [Planctomycetia bacterium]
YQSLDWHLAEKPPHEGVQKWVRELNRLARTEPSLHEVDFSSDGFEWIDLHDRDASVISFLRKARNPADSILVVCNFTPATRLGYRVGAPKAGTYRLLFNSDAKEYGGSGVGAGELEARPEPQTLQSRPFSIPVDLPPLAAIAYRVPR